MCDQKQSRVLKSQRNQNSPRNDLKLDCYFAYIPQDDVTEMVSWFALFKYIANL